MSKEAMEKAVDALEASKELVIGARRNMALQGNAVAMASMPHLELAEQKHLEAIAALRKALAQPQQEPIELTDGHGNQISLMQAIDHALNAAEATGSGRLRKILLAAKQALAQPQQEPKFLMEEAGLVRTYRLPEEQEFIEAMRRRELRSTVGMTPAEIAERNARADALLDEIFSSKT